MRTLLLFGMGAALFVIAASVAGYLYWFHEEPRSSGALTEALLAHVDPNEPRQILDEVAASHFAAEAPITERQAILEENGFDCVIRPANIEGNEILSCRRPIEGTRYCNGFNFYAYQSAAGEIIESLMSAYRVPDQDKAWGRCPYGPPPVHQ